MDDTGIVAGLVRGKLFFFFQDGNADVRMIEGNLIRRCQTDNPAPYHDNIKINILLHWLNPLKYQIKLQGYTIIKTIHAVKPKWCSLSKRFVDDKNPALKGGAKYRDCPEPPLPPAPSACYISGMISG